MGTMQNIDLGKTQITDKIRVSSAAIFYESWFGDYYQLETWIFSDDKDMQKSHQIIHCTCMLDIPEKEINNIRKIHSQISDNLNKKYNDANNKTHKRYNRNRFKNQL